MTYEEITERYGKGYLTDKQLDGAGAAEGDPEITENCVTVGWISQEQADAVRAGAADPEKADMQAAIEIYEGGGQ
ncbi:hypothetical protein [Anaerotruncus massiliensis (ex Liu et al. 2021)]|uniref:hypothetical protein n=1 Tax=Anaerotruncus massiliensis (ex Liu et al. 2021) TaxID=2321404 RepID=UPI003AB116B0